MGVEGELAGKVAIVTGGANGLGLAMVEVFAEAGAQVVIGDVDIAAGEAVAARMGEVAFHPTDVAEADQMQALVDFAVARFGGLQVMVNNAGIASSIRRFMRDDFRDFDRVMGVDLYGVMVGTQRAARHMAANGGGSIVNVASVGGVNPGVGLMTYRAAKAAVIHVSRSMAIELAEHAIRVNCLTPGNIPTAINADVVSVEVVNKLQPLRRRGTARDVAEAALYLASDRSSHVTGIVLPVDGGSSAGPTPIDLRPRPQTP